MNSMNKLLTAFERRLESLAQARVKAARMRLGGAPWSLHIVAARRYAEPGWQKTGDERTNFVHQDCTTAGQIADEIEPRRIAA